LSNVIWKWERRITRLYLSDTPQLCRKHQ